MQRATCWFLLLVYFTLTSSCAPFLSRRIPPHELAFFDDSPVGRSPAYRDYKLLEPSDRARISYLLWRMEYSGLKFWRNGVAYAGRDGAAWLRWKLRTFYPDVKTPEEFIEQVATRSEKTKVSYKVYCPYYYQYQCLHSLRDILQSELKALQEYEKNIASGLYGPFQGELSLKKQGTASVKAAGAVAGDKEQVTLPRKTTTAHQTVDVLGDSAGKVAKVLSS